MTKVMTDVITARLRLFNVDYLSAILSDRGIGGKQGNSFRPRLGNKKPVKRVFVNRRQFTDTQDMAAGNDKLGIPPF